jgi:hypothetical protein
MNGWVRLTVLICQMLIQAKRSKTKMKNTDDIDRQANLLGVLVFAFCASFIILCELSLLNPSTFFFLAIFFMSSVFHVCKILPTNQQIRELIEPDQP